MVQNRAPLNTLRLYQPNTNAGHIVYYSTLVIGHTEYPCDMLISLWPFVTKKLRDTHCQDMVFIRLPGISDSAFQLRTMMGNIWFCKRFLLFKISTKTDSGMQQHECAYISVLEEAKKSRSYCAYCAYNVYCAYFAYCDGFVSHLILGG
jgi:hypothetical protein